MTDFGPARLRVTLDVDQAKDQLDQIDRNRKESTREVRNVQDERKRLTDERKRAVPKKGRRLKDEFGIDQFLKESKDKFKRRERLKKQAVDKVKSRGLSLMPLPIGGSVLGRLGIAGAVISASMFTAERLAPGAAEVAQDLTAGTVLEEVIGGMQLHINAVSDAIRNVKTEIGLIIAKIASAIKTPALVGDLAMAGFDVDATYLTRMYEAGVAEAEFEANTKRVQAQFDHVRRMEFSRKVVGPAMRGALEDTLKAF